MFRFSNKHWAWHRYNTGGAHFYFILFFCFRVLENHVLLGTRIDRKISARDVFYRRAQHQEQKSKAAAAATAARQGLNASNSAMTRNRLRACKVVVF